MEDKKGFNRSESNQTEKVSGVLVKISLFVVSLALALFTAIVVNI